MTRPREIRPYTDNDPDDGQALAPEARACIGCGRDLQLRGGRGPHPSERLCGWCRQWLAIEARRRRLLAVVARDRKVSDPIANPPPFLRRHEVAEPA